MTSGEKIRRVWEREQEKWGLESWKLLFSNQRRHLGYCKPRRKIVSLSLAFMNTNSYPVMKDTLLHEIAHALHYIETGRSNHDADWREIAKRVGCRPERCAPVDGLNMPRGKYVGVCPVCRKAVHFYRKVSRSYSCNDCTKGYNPKYKLKMLTTDKYEMNGGKLRTPIVYKKARSK